MNSYYQDETVTLYLGDCREIMPSLGVIDHIITDPPYSERTHRGHDATQSGHKGYGYDGAERKSLAYNFLSDADCIELSNTFSNICDGWIVWMCDHTLAPTISQGLEDNGRYVFAPLPFYAPGSRVRMAGDGPSSWTVWIVVSRTAKQARWGTLPGGYAPDGPGWHDSMITGGKPLALMQAIVGDYSRKGDTILDPFCGAGTTCRAAKDLGRACIGIDMNEAHLEMAAKRCAQEVLQLDY